MIQTPIGYLAILFSCAALIMWFVRTHPYKIFNYVPAIVIIYVFTMIAYSAGLWEMNDEITVTRQFIQSNFVPMMVFIMCLSCDVRRIARLGPKLLAIFLCGSATVCLGFFISFVLIGRHFEYAAKIFATVNASFIGGSENFLAVADALVIEDGAWGNLLLMVNITYSFWIVILVLIAPFAERFNRWTKADVSEIHRISERLEVDAVEKKYYNNVDMLIVVGLGFAALQIARVLTGYMPQIAFIDASVWPYIFVTAFGLILAPTGFGKLKGSNEIATLLIWITITVSASYTNVFEIVNSWVFVLAGFFALVIHAVVMCVLAKLFRWDLHSIGTSSIANVGGPSTAPVVCGTYHQSYVSIGVLMGALGSIIGTLIGLTMYQVFLMVV